MDNADRVFFAAANSAEGFVSFYSDVFYGRKIKRRYLIKGGPGTGKSTFMKKMAQNATENGFGVEYYRCSSDPDSLDGIIIGERIAFFDATSPHSAEAMLAGAEDELIDLGAFWDSDVLESEQPEIATLSKLKKECFKRAYGFLAAAGHVESINRSIVERYVDFQKLDLVLDRILKSIPQGRRSDICVGICNSFGMKGKVHLKSYENMAKKLYVVQDFCGSGVFLLEKLIEYAKMRGDELTVSYSNLHPNFVDAVFFENPRVSFVLSSADKDTMKEYEKLREVIYINMKRFVKSEEGWKHDKAKIKSNNRLKEEIFALAEKEFKEAGNVHFALENIYRKSMDFENQSLFLDEFAKKIITKLNKYEKSM